MKYENRKIEPTEYSYLRESVGWWETDKSTAQHALASSVCSIAVMSQGRIVGMGRVIGDGLYYYIQDLIVHPAHQSKGIGRKTMGMLMQYINSTLPKAHLSV